jgi:protein-export membrane protein SecD
MKRCPACSRVYDDDDMRFCLDDGTTLIDRLDTADPPPTLAFSNKVPMATIEEVFRPEVAPRQHAERPPAGPAVHKKRRVLPWLLGIGALLVLGSGIVLAVLVLRPNRSLPWHLTFEMEQGTSNREAALKETASVIESRLNALGIPNFEVKPQSDSTTDRILVSLPSVADPERIKLIISSGGKLELTHVISPPSPAPCQTYDTKEEAIASLNSRGTVPSNRRVLPYVGREELGSGRDQKSTKWAVVESPPIVDGSELRTANALLIREGDYEIQFALKAAGAEKFGAWTGANINEYLAVVLDGEIQSVAFIRSQIFDQGMISGRFTKQAAEDLALTLKSGALPGRLILINESNDK